MSTPFDSLGSPDWSDTQGSTSGNFTDTSTINDSHSVTFAFRQVDVPASPVGILIEAGAGGDGMALSFDGVGSLVGAAGKGNTTSTDNDTVFVTLDATPLAGKTCDIYWCLRPTAPGRGKIYAFEYGTGTYLGMAYTDIPNSSRMGTQDTEGDWTGSNNYGVGVDNSVRSGVSTAHFNGTMHNGAEAWDDWLPSDFDDNVYFVAHELTADDLSVSTIIDPPVIAAAGTLLANELTSSSHIDDTTIGQDHVVAADDISVSTTTIDTPQAYQETLYGGALLSTNGGPTYRWTFHDTLDETPPSGITWSGSQTYGPTILDQTGYNCLVVNGSEWNLSNRSDINDGTQYRKSISLWIQPSGTTGTIYEQGGSTNWMHLYLDAGTLYWAVGTDHNPQGHIGVSGIQAGETYHIVAELDAPAQIIRLYVNGVQYQTSTTYGTSFPNHTGDISLAGPTDTGDKDSDSSVVTNGISGKIAELSYWAETTRLLTAGEVTVLYETGAGLLADDLTADDIDTTTTIAAATLGQIHDISSGDIVAASSIAAPDVGQRHSLAAADIGSTVDIDRPDATIVVSLTVSDVSVSTDVAEPIVAVSSAFGIIPIDVSTDIGSPTIGQIYPVDDLSIATDIGSPTFGQTHVLPAADQTAAVSIDRPDLTAIPAVFDGVPIDITGGTSIDTATIGQIHVLVSVDIATVPDVPAPQIGQYHAFTIDPWTIVTTIDPAAVYVGDIREIIAITTVYRTVESVAATVVHDTISRRSIYTSDPAIAAGTYGDTITKAGTYADVVTIPVEYDEEE
jgi:hypothetical protein